LVARFSGTAYTAEREGDELLIYLMTGDPIATNAVGDQVESGVMTAAKVQRLGGASRR